MATACAATKEIGAIAMTEPDTGRDLKAITTTARPDRYGFVLNGAKTFITNGTLADIVIVVAKTDPLAGRRGISLLVVEDGMASQSPTFKQLAGLHASSIQTRSLHTTSCRGVECARALRLSSRT